MAGETQQVKRALLAPSCPFRHPVPMPTVEACPGSCNSRWREAREAFKQALDAYGREGILDPNQTRPEPPSIQPVLGDPVWCGRCASRIRSDLADLDELAAMLGWVADGHAASAGSDAGRVSGTAETMSPSDAADELADLMNVLTEHENAYREQVLAIGTPPRRGFLAATSTQCIAWLGHHLDDILTSSIAEGFGADVLAWHTVWKRQAKAGTRKLTKPMRCPACQLLMLVWQEGENRVDCANPDCGRVLSYADYENLVEEKAGRPAHDDDTETPLAS